MADNSTPSPGGTATVSAARNMRWWWRWRTKVSFTSFRLVHPRRGSQFAGSAELRWSAYTSPRTVTWWESAGDTFVPNVLRSTPKQPVDRQHRRLHYRFAASARPRRLLQSPGSEWPCRRHRGRYCRIENGQRDSPPLPATSSLDIAAGPPPRLTPLSHRDGARAGGATETMFGELDLPLVATTESRPSSASA